VERKKEKEKEKKAVNPRPSVATISVLRGDKSAFLSIQDTLFPPSFYFIYLLWGFYGESRVFLPPLPPTAS
jgi:hypothetical protein